MLNDRNFTCDYGRLEPVSPGIRRIVAPNPGPFTFNGTGTYVVGRGKVAVIDPGPELAEHVEALLAGARRRDRHAHPRHPYPSRPFAGRRGAQGGDRRADLRLRPAGRQGRRHRSKKAAICEFHPIVALRDGDAVEGPGWQRSRRCIRRATPRTISASRCAEERRSSRGDHVMGWSTSVVAPPDGDMAAYMRSLDKLLARERRDLLADPWRADPRSREPRRGADRASPRPPRGDPRGARQPGRSDPQGIVAGGLSRPRSRGSPAPRRSRVLAHLIELEAEGLVRRQAERWARRG